jgi:hypothetical protein
LPVTVIERIRSVAFSSAEQERYEKQAEDQGADDAKAGKYADWKTGSSHASISDAEPKRVEEVLQRLLVP